MTSEGELGDYLNSFLSPASLEKQKQWPRVQCCGTSRSLYCSECYSLLIPREEWPESVRQLPFQLHIVLHDRRNAATGLHAKVLDESVDRCLTDDESKNVQVFDIKRLDPLPRTFSEHTYVLFPSKDSVPLESVRHVVQTLVVLDCKWTRSSSRHDPRIQKLPCVHLTPQPNVESYYWRWHSAGPQCLSTIEAIYQAAQEVDPDGSSWLPWMWLFGLQRAAAGGVSQEQKRQQQALRRQEGTEKQARDRERGKLLAEQHKRDLVSGMEMGQPRKPQWQVQLENQQAHDT